MGKLIKKCPCGKGGLIETAEHFKKSKRSKYKSKNKHNVKMHHHFNSCPECNEKFIFYRGYWITRQNYSTCQKLEQALKEETKSFYKYLYDKHFQTILSVTKTKKGLYEILSINHLFGVGSLQSFYTNGIEQYIPPQNSLAIIDFIKLMELTDCFSEDDHTKISDYKERKALIEAYPCQHQFKTE